MSRWLLIYILFIWVCPSKLPIISTKGPLLTRRESNVWRRSWIQSFTISSASCACLSATSTGCSSARVFLGPRSVAPLRAHLSGLPTLAASDAGHGGVDESLVLKEPQVFPAPGARVMDRLIGRATGGTRKPTARLEADVKVDFSLASKRTSVTLHEACKPSAILNKLVSGPMVPPSPLVSGSHILRWEVAEANSSGASGAAISEVSAPDAPHVVTTTSGATLNRPARLNPHKSRRDQKVFLI